MMNKTPELNAIELTGGSPSPAPINPVTAASFNLLRLLIVPVGIYIASGDAEATADVIIARIVQHDVLCTMYEEKDTRDARMDVSMWVGVGGTGI